VGQAIDLTRHPLGGLELRIHRRRFKERQVTAGQAQAVGQIVGQFLAGEPGQVVAHHDALSQGLVHRHT
jgi:hypothetical protein